MCEVCHGHPNCPVCSPEPRMIECAACQGEKETCSVCDGTGEVEDYELYEPEWDD